MSLLSIAAAGIKRPMPCPGIVRVGVEVSSEVKVSAAGNHYVNLKLSGLGEYSGGRILDRIMLTANGGTEWSSHGLARIVAILEVSGINPTATILAGDLPINEASMERVSDLVHGRDAVVRTKHNARGYIEAAAFLSPSTDAKALEELGDKKGVETGPQAAPEAPKRADAAASPENTFDGF